MRARDPPVAVLDLAQAEARLATPAARIPAEILGSQPCFTRFLRLPENTPQVFRRPEESGDRAAPLNARRSWFQRQDRTNALGAGDALSHTVRPHESVAFDASGQSLI